MVDHRFCFAFLVNSVRCGFRLDPTCTLSGVRDHARETFMSKTTTEQVVSFDFEFILFVRITIRFV